MASTELVMGRCLPVWRYHSSGHSLSPSVSPLRRCLPSSSSRVCHHTSRAQFSSHVLVLTSSSISPWIPSGGRWMGQSPLVMWSAVCSAPQSQQSLVESPQRSIFAPNLPTPVRSPLSSCVAVSLTRALSVAACFPTSALSSCEAYHSSGNSLSPSVSPPRRCLPVRRITHQGTLCRRLFPRLGLVFLCSGITHQGTLCRRLFPHLVLAFL